MIFDIPASIGSKRHYYILDGKEISPFVVNQDYVSDQYTGTFGVRRTDAIEFYTWNYNGSHSRPHAYNIERYYGNIDMFPEIDEYNFLCFVASANKLNYANITVLADSHVNFQSGNAKSTRFTIPVDNTPRVYKVSIDRIPDNYYYNIVLRGAAPSSGNNSDTSPCIKIHDLYLEGSR